MNNNLRSCVSLFGAAAFCALAACEREPGPLNSPPPKQVAVDDSPKWITHGESVVLPAGSPDDDPALASAIEKARGTAGDARRRWENAPAGDRAHWAVKWAAPLETGEVEYLWVRPDHWSPFRVEGVLLSEPVSTLRDEANRGDNISFPVEELCDWAHAVMGTTPAVIEGNFTEQALTKPADARTGETGASGAENGADG